MATWQYRCRSCGGVHELSVRPAGAMLLRCTVTREWTWHDESAFLSAAGGPAGGAGTTGRRRAGSKAAQRRPRGRAAAKKSPVRASASRKRGARKAPPRRPSRSRAGRR